MANLQVSIIIYDEPSSYANQCHVALVVAQDFERFYLYHAIEDAVTKNEMKFERSFRTRNPLTTNRNHQILRLKVPIAKANFDKLDKALSSTPIPRPRPEGWNCQSWLRQALESLAKEGLMKDVEPSYYVNMMSIINKAALPEPKKK